MRNILILILALALAAVVMACGTSPSGGAGSPTEAYKTFYAAVKSKNTDSIKAEMTQKTRAFAEGAAQRQGVTIEKMLENGLTATTFAESLPEIRDERVTGDYGSVEVWNAKDKLWEDLPFIKEEGVWKFAMGELFTGSFKSPGKGQAMKEREAANAMSGNGGVVSVNINGNGNANVISVLKERLTNATSDRGNVNK